MKHEPLKALLVDVGGTLVNDATWLTRERHEALMVARLRDAFGTDHHWFARLASHPFAESDASTWEQRTAEAVMAFLTEQGIEASAEEVERICRACAAPLSQVVELADGALDAVRAIHTLGLPMVICSNTLWRNDLDVRRDWDGFGFDGYFEACVTSHDTGFGKPHPAIFERAMAAVDARASEAAIIGDRPDLDLAGARTVGMRSIWMRPPDFRGDPQPRPDATVTRWSEVPPILRAWQVGSVSRPTSSVVAERETTTTTIRRATPTDADAIGEVHVRSWKVAYRGLLPDALIEDMAAGRTARVERVRTWLTDTDGPRRGWVAVEGDRVVGMAVTAPSRDSDAKRTTGELEAIYLAPEAIGRGVGRRLLARAVEDLRERGFDKATLWVLCENRRARRFYEAAGWQTDDATKEEERPGGTLHEVRYRRSVDAQEATE